MELNPALLCNLCQRNPGPVRALLERKDRGGPPPIHISICPLCAEVLLNHECILKEAVRLVVDAETILDERTRDPVDTERHWEEHMLRMWMADEKLLIALEHRIGLVRWRREADQLLLANVGLEVVGCRIPRVEKGRQMLAEVWAELRAREPDNRRVGGHIAKSIERK